MGTALSLGVYGYIGPKQAPRNDEDQSAEKYLWWCYDW